MNFFSFPARFTAAFLCLLLFSQAHASAAEPRIINLWPGNPPGETKDYPPEADTTTPESNKVAGERVMRIGNVTTPTLTVYPAPRETANGSAMVICPGGGHHILAWDLEGTEVAEWLNSIGVTAFVLKYRVPRREEDKRWRAAVQDAQRAMSIVRARAEEYGVDPGRIGLMGFSAGGETAVLATLFDERTYESVDESDRVSLKPDFTGLIYSAGIVERGTLQVHDYITIPKDTPPIFMAHAIDDGVPVENCLRLFELLKANEISTELHIYSEGGHGYGLRKTGQPVTSWNDRMADWMRVNGWLEKR